MHSHKHRKCHSWNPGESDCSDDFCEDHQSWWHRTGAWPYIHSDGSSCGCRQSSKGRKTWNHRYTLNTPSLFAVWCSCSLQQRTCHYPVYLTRWSLGTDWPRWSILSAISSCNRIVLADWRNTRSPWVWFPAWNSHSHYWTHPPWGCISRVCSSRVLPSTGRYNLLSL